MPYWYVYPMWHKVSFTLIAEKHLEYMTKWLRMERIDELAFPHITPHSRPIVFVHPYFFIMMRASKFISRKLHLYGALIGIDVADSDHITNLAVSMTNYAYAMIVPSNFAKHAYVRSGVTIPVHVVPHGLDPEWYSKPKEKPRYFTDIAKIKEAKGLKLILFFLWHSDYRKGWDLVFEFYRLLRRERKDVVMVLKTGDANSPQAAQCKLLGCIHISGWLTEDQKMELYDLADLYPLFSRGGGFELNGLEAIARGVITIAAKWGSWDDYLPQWALLPSRQCPYVLRDNPVHDGRGVEVIVDRAVDFAHTVLDNLDEYRAKLQDHVESYVINKFRWDVVAKQLYEIAVSVKRQLGV